MARSYLCRAKMLLLLLIPCLHWQSGRERERQQAEHERKRQRDRESENALWDGCYYCHCHFPCCCCCCSLLPLLLLLLLLLCSIFTACVCSSAKCSFHRLAQRWVGVRFFPVHQQHDNDNEDTFRVCHFPLSFANSAQPKTRDTASEPTKKFQFEKRKWIWFDTVWECASQLSLKMSINNNIIRICRIWWKNLWCWCWWWWQWLIFFLSLQFQLKCWLVFGVLVASFHSHL